MMVYVMGDIHAELSDFRRVMSDTKPGDIIIQCGDFGFVFNQEYSAALDTIEYDYKGIEIIVVPGNHDSYDLDDYAHVKCHGANARKIRDNIFYIDRGEIMDINGQTYLCISGADSTDKDWRMDWMRENKGKIWWEEEKITFEQTTEICAKLADRDFRVNYIITHEPPYRVKQRFLGNISFDRTGSDIMLNDIFNLARFDHWYCGHMHITTTIDNVTILGIAKKRAVAFQEFPACSE